MTSVALCCHLLAVLSTTATLVPHIDRVYPLMFQNNDSFITCLHLCTVDITVYHNGFHGDLNETFFVGEVDEEAKKLVQTTYECLMQAIDSGTTEAPPPFYCTC